MVESSRVTSRRGLDVTLELPTKSNFNSGFALVEITTVISKNAVSCGSVNSVRAKALTLFTDPHDTAFLLITELHARKPCGYCT